MKKNWRKRKKKEEKCEAETKKRQEEALKEKAEGRKGKRGSYSESCQGSKLQLSKKKKNRFGKMTLSLQNHNFLNLRMLVKMILKKLR